MNNPFRLPYNEPGTVKSKLMAVFGFGLFIFLFLYFFKPFGISFLNSSLQPLFTLGFGVITAAVLAVFRFLIEPFVIRRRWTLGKNILWVLLISACIGAANYF